jgi:hypothetical protein
MRNTPLIESVGTVQTDGYVENEQRGSWREAGSFQSPLSVFRENVIAATTKHEKLHQSFSQKPLQLRGALSHAHLRC